MNKIKLVLLSLVVLCLFVGCDYDSYISVDTGEKVNSWKNENGKYNYTVHDFFPTEVVVSQSDRYYILRDKSTDVLYYEALSNAGDSSTRIMVPIMKADGSCLTYTEWYNNKFGNNNNNTTPQNNYMTTDDGYTYSYEEY